MERKAKISQAIGIFVSFAENEWGILNKKKAIQKYKDLKKDIAFLKENGCIESVKISNEKKGWNLGYKLTPLGRYIFRNEKF